MLNLLLISIPFLFIFGSFLHFAYNLSKENKIVGLFSPVNESIFEHSKLLLIPLTIFWVISYFFIRDDVNVNNYFLAMLSSIVFSIVFMIAFYYTYKEIIGNSYLWIDILDLLISLFVGQIIANHVYEYSNGVNWIVSLGIIIVIFICFIYLTISPFKTPFFYDKKNKIYGIKKK